MNLDTLVHAMSGTAAGALSTMATHPVDSVKTRFQAQDGTAARRIGNVAYTSSLQVHPAGGSAGRNRGRRGA